MPQIKYSTRAMQDLGRLQEFLATKSPAAAKRAATAIVKEIKILGMQPQIGRPIDDMPDEFREWIVDFGANGYVVRYQIEQNTVLILGVRHQREVGF